MGELLYAVAGSAGTLRVLDLIEFTWHPAERTITLPALRELTVGKGASAVLSLLPALAPNLRWLDLKLDASQFPADIDAPGGTPSEFAARVAEAGKAVGPRLRGLYLSIVEAREEDEDRAGRCSAIIDKLVANCANLYYLGLDDEGFDPSSIVLHAPKTIVALEISADKLEATDVTAIVSWMLRNPRGMLCLSRRARRMAHFDALVAVRDIRRSARDSSLKAVPIQQRAQVRDLLGVEETRRLLGYTA